MCAAPSSPKLTAEDLAGFTGTETWYHHHLVRSILFTDGVRYLAETAKAYWLLDEIALAQRAAPLASSERLQVWKLIVDLTKRSAILSCKISAGEPIIVKKIDFTDFPLEAITIFVTNNVILLPSEY
jgi:hypothetical protein